MNEETLEVKIDNTIADHLNKMTKKELVERIGVAALAASVAEKKAKALQAKLDKAEAYVEQGRAMITAVMDRWYEYDV